MLATPAKVRNIIDAMNKKSSCIKGDIPFRIISYFSEDISKPLCNILNSIFIDAQYPEIWKTEFITPVEKHYPVNNLKDYRPISSLLSCAKVADKLMASYICENMTKDMKQYGNEKLR